MSAEIIKFPETTYVLTCKHCRSRDFGIHLGSADPGDMVGYECAGCHFYWDLDGIAEFKAMEDDNNV